jgi:hypothetical protein
MLSLLRTALIGLVIGAGRKAPHARQGPGGHLDYHATRHCRLVSC